jgi:hypothetical protein
MDRRTFLSSATGVATAALLPARAAAIAPIRRAGKSQLRVGLAGYSMRQYLEAAPGTKGAMDLLGFIDYAATLGVDAVELTSYYFPKEVTDAYLNEVKRRCHT